MSQLGGETRDIDVEGVTVRCHVDGPEDAPPVVLVHGAGPDAAGVSWKKAFPALAGSYRTYALDLPGYGESDPVPQNVAPTTDFYVGVLDVLLDELDLAEVTLVGISKGGGIVLGYTLDRSDRVERLVLVDSFGLGDRVPGGRKTAVAVKTPKLLELSWGAMKKSRKVTKASLGNVVHPENVHEEFVDDVHREIRRPNSGETFFRFAREEMHLSGPRTNYFDRIPDLPVATLFVHGAEDHLIPLELSERAARVAPAADLSTIEQCGHWVTRERPEAFVSRLEEWLEAELTGDARTL
ncbi:Pimeloyl-ACP methyl ester carboxylesterase [Halogranum amylolyticum]|uniref:Pimeloyl-ACP methyl ester carboxylesterase n=1 Tax=Halogranum amylolyticum TaxID=660520 RepID=A0A1H8W8H1_9EURY|nr:alpha/beta hydrolase [Halogranum amylolyticum]SEP23965.1 Pimeloyl-ACP methyl ester carboxylesterase [Halogranum amylolyticum]